MTGEVKIEGRKPKSECSFATDRPPGLKSRTKRFVFHLKD